MTNEGPHTYRSAFRKERGRGGFSDEKEVKKGEGMHEERGRETRPHRIGRVENKAMAAGLFHVKGSTALSFHTPPFHLALRKVGGEKGSLLSAFISVGDKRSMITLFSASLK